MKELNLGEIPFDNIGLDHHIWHDRNTDKDILISLGFDELKADEYILSDISQPDLSDEEYDDMSKAIDNFIKEHDGLYCEYRDLLSRIYGCDYATDEEYNELIRLVDDKRRELGFIGNF